MQVQHVNNRIQPSIYIDHLVVVFEELELNLNVDKHEQGGGTPLMIITRAPMLGSCSKL